MNEHQARLAPFAPDGSVESTAAYIREEPCRLRIEQDIDAIADYLARQDIHDVWREDISQWLQTTKRSSLSHNTRNLAELYLVYAANAMITPEDRRVCMEGCRGLSRSFQKSLLHLSSRVTPD
jgi:hypothetical protein